MYYVVIKDIDYSLLTPAQTSSYIAGSLTISIGSVSLNPNFYKVKIVNKSYFRMSNCTF